MKFQKVFPFRQEREPDQTAPTPEVGEVKAKKLRKGQDVKGMLQPGNTHVGWLIHTFSTPAFSTCPGATFACLLVCYALAFRFFLPKNLERHRTHWERALDTPDEFVKAMIAEIRFKQVLYLRIHVAGDFFSVAYIRSWSKIARQCKRVKFLFYTRSWRVPELVGPLVELARLPNVFAFWSEDRNSGAAILPVGRRCFLCVDDGDEKLVPPGIDLVFRHDTKRPRKWINGAWVCPKENGTEAEITCSACLRCLLPGPFPVPPAMRRPERDVTHKLPDSSNSEPASPESHTSLATADPLPR